MRKTIILIACLCISYFTYSQYDYSKTPLMKISQFTEIEYNFANKLYKKIEIDSNFYVYLYINVENNKIKVLVANRTNIGNNNDIFNIEQLREDYLYDVELIDNGIKLSFSYNEIGTIKYFPSEKERYIWKYDEVKSGYYLYRIRN